MNHIIFNGKPIEPSKIVCIGRNYADHAKELNNEIPSSPVIFIKPNSALSDELFAGNEDQLHYEGEIAFLVIDQQLAGVGFGLDLTDRPLQTELKKKGLPWERAKAFDRSALFSEFVTFDDTKPLRLCLTINDQVVQAGGYDLMLFKPDALLAEISQTFTLNDGDIIMTGTPRGVGAFSRGARFIGEILSGSELLVMQEWTAQ
jgi:2-keto-4-pentenoate hydratase/2-oxohepta-3-ene-1,7-dioic acid hydratase in catechol pathway